MLSKIAEVTFALVLVAGVPALAFATARSSEVPRLPRRALYFSAVLSQWMLAAVGAIVVYATSPGFSGAGFRAVSLGPFWRWTVLLTAVTLTALGLIVLLQRRGWWPAESPLVYLLLPETFGEKLWAVMGIAPTAAVCEGFLYRGYLLGELSRGFHSVYWGWAVSSFAFGLAHVYQGWNGMVRAAALGALLAWPVVRLGTLYPSMASHFLIDAVALAWLGPRFLRRESHS